MTDLPPGPQPAGLRLIQRLPLTPFGIPAYDEGYFSFIPGDGCAPSTYLRVRRVSLKQPRTVLIETKNSLELTQVVLSGVVTGDTSSFFELQGAPGFAAGLEYRKNLTLISHPGVGGLTRRFYAPGTLISEVPKGPCLRPGSSRQQ